MDNKKIIKKLKNEKNILEKELKKKDRELKIMEKAVEIVKNPTPPLIFESEVRK